MKRILLKGSGFVAAVFAFEMLVPSRPLSLVYSLNAASATASETILPVHSASTTRSESGEVRRLREFLAPSALQSYKIAQDINFETIGKYVERLGADGVFSDLSNTDEKAKGEAFRRFWVLSVAYVRGPRAQGDQALKVSIYRGLVHYSRIEAESASSFTTGAFSIPTSFLSAWLCLYNDIQRDISNPELKSIVEDLLTYGGKVAAHSWNHPDSSPDRFRSKNPLDPRVFRDQGHFTVANFVPYRPVVEYAVFLGDERYLDLIAETARRSLHELTNPADPAQGFWTEGINPDYSVYAHGPQSYPFGYGKDYISGFLSLAEWFRDGPRHFTNAEYEVVANVMLEGLRWHAYRDQAEYSVLGRHDLYPDSGEGINEVMAGLISRLLNVAGSGLSRRSELQDELARLKGGAKELVGSRYFWATEDYVHRGDGFSVFVNMNSTRTGGPENIVPNSQQNYHFGDGVTMVYRDGTEFRATRGAMNFTALPGITAEFSSRPPPNTQTWTGFAGTESFAGGVSDGSAGACAFVSALQGSSSVANKAYFFNGKTMVCLGSGIRALSETQNPIRTTLNQTAWRTAIQVLSDGASREYEIGEAVDLRKMASSPTGIWQDGISYIVGAGQSLVLNAEVRKTDWPALAEVNRGKPAPADAPVFFCSLEHENPLNASYAYAVLLNSTPQEMRQAVESPSWIVLANSTDVQAVQFPGDDNLIQAIFRSPGTVVTKDGFHIKVDRPLIVMLRRKQGAETTLTYQDPLHQRQITEVRIRLGDQNGGTEHTLKLPQGLYLGAPRHKVFSTDVASIQNQNK